ncbi:hypothetical protein H310_10467 [Aphanomyces invadans]|uniref:Uncharacterized protein n=1 Tax=Aphanomyces invadans TaxID=157072 RepID=A0A024TSI3_9STRA|nr:hypothetical protein H310_10467 [Aphanomyces invadans]ETV96302.1 hypothetical protein H310_10467 [Aphanomyces invadans]|eukprot:XP_008875094.1 hypothetical protein H310_10467 [Aphanomyces invadans]
MAKLLGIFQTTTSCRGRKFRTSAHGRGSRLFSHRPQQLVEAMLCRRTAKWTLTTCTSPSQRKTRTWVRLAWRLTLGRSSPSWRTGGCPKDENACGRQGLYVYLGWWAGATFS